MKRFGLIENFFDDWFLESIFQFPAARRLLAQNSPEIAPIETYKSTLADIWEEKDAIKAKIDLAGVDKKDIDIKVHENFIEIKAEKKTEKKDEGKDFFRQERHFSGYYKAFSLPKKIDTGKIEAKYQDGVLEITAPKIEKELKKIEVK
ncbi:MAG: Hsp20/alpha crystallin family protein [Candidatus Diapherotrites archaeon]|nr:Hsp20/alpha crystallin family protein [Candidatus Diapherotrites archaeon]